MVERAAGICGAVVVTDEIERLVFGTHEVAGSNLAVGRSGIIFFSSWLGSTRHPKVHLLSDRQF